MSFFPEEYPRFSKPSVKLVLFSENVHNNKRVITTKWKYPKQHLAQLNMHGQLCKNASSSRAVPVKKVIEQVTNDPYVPVRWSKNQKGMQGYATLDYDQQIAAAKQWLEARDAALKYVNGLVDLEVHKQIVNRLLEPWTWATVIVTATEVENFFALRDAPDAQDEIAYCARQMANIYYNAEPQPLAFGQWHLPFVRQSEHSLQTEDQLRISVARCCRVSYNNVDGTPTELAKDRILAASLQDEGHWSPFQHQALTVDVHSTTSSGQFKGFVQYRKTFTNEVRSYKYIPRPTDVIDITPVVD
jgi:hypothetical protein